MNKAQKMVARILVLIFLAVLASCSGSSEHDEKKKGKHDEGKSKHAGVQPAQQAQPPQQTRPAQQAQPAQQPGTVAQSPPSQPKQVAQASQPGSRAAGTPDSVYRENCGACHPAYAPELLPSASWDKIMSKPDDHFGESVDLDAQSKNTILGYLKANSAERSGSKKGSKIMGSLGGRTPIRITEIPYIQDKHRKISPAVFKRPSIGSLSRCSACHAGADKGAGFNKHSVTIPK